MNPRRCVVPIAAWLTLPLVSFAQPQYTVHDLGTLGGSSSVAIAINNSGQVVGNSVTATGGSRAFRTAASSAINPTTDDLGTLFPSSAIADSGATGINSSGQVAGGSIKDPITFRAFRTAPNAAINPVTDDLGTLGHPNSSASGINDIGQVVGSSSGEMTTRAFRTAPNSAINPATDNLGTLGGSFSFATGINNSGQVVGTSATATGQSFGFRTAPNSAINPATDGLGTLGGSFSSAAGINSSGQVVGSSLTAAGQVHAFRTAPNSNINPPTDDLGTLGGPRSEATGINNSGQVVGFSTTTSGQQHAFLFSGGVMHDLNSLIPANSGWSLEQANAINDLRQIVGFGVVNGAVHAFRLDPVLVCTPPVISGASVTPPVLWPPNQKLVSANVRYTLTPPSCGGACTLSVSSTEPVNGSDITSPDWLVLDPHTVELRAERAGHGDGRVYTIAINCTNSAGNRKKTVTVLVPHDRRK
jgi:probable HAF family extracellular repeat protein